MWLHVFIYLNDTDFTSLLQNCSELYFLSLDVCVRRYSYKHNVCSWLDQTITKDFVLIYGNPKSSVLQKKLGLKKLLENIHLNKADYIHGMNTCMNEFLNNYKMAGGITRKNLNQWQTWDQRVQYKISEFNTGQELQLDRLLTTLQLPFEENLRMKIRKKHKKKQKNRIYKSSHEYKKD